MTRPNGFWLNAALLSGSLSVAIVLIEVALRLLAPQPTGLSYQDRFGLQMHYPGITRMLPQYGHEVSFNSVGMRDVEHSIGKPTGTFRILLLGDSFMEALQVPFEASFPSLLKRELERGARGPVEVINAGVSGWGTDDELRYLTHYGLEYRPDLVVVMMTLHNDFSDNLRQEWHSLKGDMLVENSVSPTPDVEYRLSQIKAFIATRFQLYQLWRRVRHGKDIRVGGRQLNAHVTQLFGMPTSASITTGARLTSLLLSKLNAVTVAAGGRVVLVLLPIKYQLSDSAFADFVSKSGAVREAMKLDQPQGLIGPAAGQLGIPTIDLLPSFRRWTSDCSSPLYLSWDGHWNETGHRLAAAAVAVQIVEWELVP